MKSKFKYKKVSENQNLNNCIAGFSSGLIVSFVTTPIELVKCRSQIQTSTKKNIFFNCLKDIYKKNGLMGFFHGFRPTLTQRRNFFKDIILKKNPTCIFFNLPRRAKSDKNISKN